MTRRKTDPEKLGLHVREFTDTQADRDGAARFCKRLGCKMNRSTVTPSEWLFIETACKARPGGAYLEIGVYRHASTCAFLRAMEGTTAQLTTVDIEYRRPNIRHPDEDVQSRWAKITGSSFDVLPKLPACCYDVILVDGLHTIEGVRHDTQQALRLVAPGGVVICHDANSPPLMLAVLEHIAADQIDFMRCHVDHTKGLAIFPRGWPE